MKDSASQANPVMKPSRVFPRRRWIASLSLAMTVIDDNAIEPKLTSWPESSSPRPVYEESSIANRSARSAVR
jgi:hypothetical protein